MAAKPASDKILFDEFIEKGRRFCAYRDRSKKETTERLLQLGANQNLIDNILSALEKEGFIDEKRFAKAFARGKFINNHWGKIRIERELRLHQINSEIIEEALKEINQNQYFEVLESIAKKKLLASKALSEYIAKGKTAEYCIRKGFEPDICWKIVNKL
jgi:regulatory protein